MHRFPEQSTNHGDDMCFSPLDSVLVRCFGQLQALTVNMLGICPPDKKMV